MCLNRQRAEAKLFSYFPGKALVKDHLQDFRFPIRKEINFPQFLIQAIIMAVKETFTRVHRLKIFSSFRYDLQSLPEGVQTGILTDKSVYSKISAHLHYTPIVMRSKHHFL